MSEPEDIVNAGGATPATASRELRALTPPGGPLPTSPRAIMYAYPWDILDHGLERTLDELEECGIEAVQLSFSYHVATFLNPRNPRRKIRFGEPGVLEFDLAADAAMAWPFDTPVSADATSANAGALLRALTARGFGVVAWVVYLYNHNVAKRRPELAVENAFGDRHGAQLCPANPQVRDYVARLTEAVLEVGTEQQALLGFVAESLSYLPYDYGFLNLKSAVVPGAALGRLLSLCFCENCAALAGGRGVEVSALKSEVTAVATRELANLPDGRLLEIGAARWWQESESLAAYLATRADTASDLQRSVLERARAAGLRTGTNSAETQDDRVTGVPNAAVAALRSDFRFEILPQMTAEQAQRLVENAGAAAGEGATLYALAQLANFSSEASFRSSLELVADLGIRHFRLYEYGLLSERQLDWLRNAKDLWSRAVDDSQDPATGRIEI